MFIVNVVTLGFFSAGNISVGNIGFAEVGLVIIIMLIYQFSSDEHIDSSSCIKYPDSVSSHLTYIPCSGLTIGSLEVFKLC